MGEGDHTVNEAMGKGDERVVGEANNVDELGEDSGGLSDKSEWIGDVHDLD